MGVRVVFVLLFLERSAVVKGNGIGCLCSKLFWFLSSFFKGFGCFVVLYCIIFLYNILFFEVIYGL